MATAAHRARDRGASGDRRSLSEGGRDRGAAAWRMGAATAPAKPANENEVTTGSGAAKPTHTINPNPENLSTKEKAKPANANVVTTGFGVESTGLDVENPKRIPSASAGERFRGAIELGLSRGRDATAIWQDLAVENGFDGGLSVKRVSHSLPPNNPDRLGFGSDHRTAIRGLCKRDHSLRWP
jgi:hypothetical protein